MDNSIEGLLILKVIEEDKFITIILEDGQTFKILKANIQKYTTDVSSEDYAGNYLSENSDLIMFYGIYPNVNYITDFQVWYENDILYLVDRDPNGHDKIEIPKEDILKITEYNGKYIIVDIDCEDGIKGMVFENKISKILNEIGINNLKFNDKKEEFHISLINCSVCGKRISIESENCPNCGQPNKYKKITCPNCRSGNVEKITVGDKIFSGALVGLFAIGKISKTWQCRDCDYKW